MACTKIKIQLYFEALLEYFCAVSPQRFEIVKGGLQGITSACNKGIKRAFFRCPSRSRKSAKAYWPGLARLIRPRARRVQYWRSVHAIHRTAQAQVE